MKSELISILRLNYSDKNKVIYLISDLLLLIYPIGVIILNLGYIISGVMAFFLIISFFINYMLLGELSKFIERKQPRLDEITVLMLEFLKKIWSHYQYWLYITVILLFITILYMEKNNVEYVWLSLVVWIMYWIVFTYSRAITKTVNIYFDYDEIFKK